MVWLHFIKGVPTLGFPKIINSVGRNVCPVFCAASAWLILVKTVMPLVFSIPSNRSAVVFTLWALWVLIRPLLNKPLLLATAGRDTSKLEMNISINKRIDDHP